MCTLKHENYLLCKKHGWSDERIAREYELSKDDLNFYVNNNFYILNEKRDEGIMKVRF